MTVMLVTSLCWWLYDGDWFEMVVTESLCWRLFSLCWWISQYIKSVNNILNWSPTSQTWHQHIWSPISVTNIDVTEFCRQHHWSKNFTLSRYPTYILNLGRSYKKWEQDKRWHRCWWRMLETKCVGHKLKMLMTDLRCWWQNHYVGDFFRYVGDFFTVFNRSPTS